MVNNRQETHEDNGARGEKIQEHARLIAHREEQPFGDGVFQPAESGQKHFMIYLFQTIITNRPATLPNDTSITHTYLLFISIPI